MRKAVSAAFAGLALCGQVAVAHADAGYDKGFVIREKGEEDFKLKINGRMQPRYRWLSAVPAAPAVPGGSAHRDNSQAFDVHRARIKFTGHMYDKSLKFFLQADFGKSRVGIKDAGVEYVIVPDTLHFKFGQFKKSYSGQELTSSSKLALINRALSVGEGAGGRDVGFQIGNGKRREVIWAAGLFNGNGTAGTPADFKPVAVGRIVYRYNNIKNYSEADLEGGALRFAVGANVNADLNATNGDDVALVAGADAVVKVQGLSLSGELYSDRTKGAKKTGFFGQAGYVIGGRYQPVIRFSSVNPEGDKNNTTEIAGGVSVYYREHHVKWQTALSLLGHEGSDTTDRLLQTQLQFSF